MSVTQVHLCKTEPAAYQALDAFSNTVGESCANRIVAGRHPMKACASR
ncbi:hypothetical protein [Microbacterium sp.]|nr:hypothetical protein [Microbacterium sp.]